MEKKILAWVWNRRTIAGLRRKARKINSGLLPHPHAYPVASSLADAYRRLWAPFGGDKPLSWLTMYTNVSGITDYRYVPETVYYTRIEPCLNNKAMAKAFSDKNLYHRYLGDFNLPETILANIEGVWYNGETEQVDTSRADDILKHHQRFIVKPALDSGGGRGVMMAGSGFPPLDTTDAIGRACGKNFIIQEVIEGAPFYRQFCDTSLNTLRVLTYRSVTDEAIVPLWSLLRVGRNGAITDNQASGGYACGVTPDGRLTGKAVDKWGAVFSSVNGVPLQQGLLLEGFEQMIAAAIKIAPRLPYARLLGLDLCIDAAGKVRLIEVNNINNEINFYQMLYGPLFGDYTAEVIVWCKGRPRSFMIDYEI